VDVRTAALQLSTAEMTIRRDLDVLVAQGVARRVRGGAVSLLMQGEELPFLMRELDSAEAKQRIATLAASLILDGEAVVVDSGTTGLAVAEVLVGRRLTVMPLSLQAAAALSVSSATTLVMPGGTARFGEGSLVGPMTEASLSSLRFDTAVLTCCGVSPDGAVTAHDIEDAAVKRAAHASSARTILVAEGAKFTRTARAVVYAINQVDVVVTDTEAPDSAIETMLAAGIEVHRA
jgi:DeoR/GlpR family transcriptional regulator of sugar metabolism